MVCVENEPFMENLKDLDINDFDNEIKLVILEYFQNGDPVEVSD